MTSNPLREAMEAGDTCEVGRLLMEQHGELLARLAVPAKPEPPNTEESK